MWIDTVYHEDILKFKDVSFLKKIEQIDILFRDSLIRNVRKFSIKNSPTSINFCQLLDTQNLAATGLLKCLIESLQFMIMVTCFTLINKTKFERELGFVGVFFQSEGVT